MNKNQKASITHLAISIVFQSADVKCLLTSNELSKLCRISEKKSAVAIQKTIQSMQSMHSSDAKHIAELLFTYANSFICTLSSKSNNSEVLVKCSSSTCENDIVTYQDIKTGDIDTKLCESCQN